MPIGRLGPVSEKKRPRPRDTNGRLRGRVLASLQRALQDAVELAVARARFTLLQQRLRLPLRRPRSRPRRAAGRLAGLSHRLACFGLESAERHALRSEFAFGHVRRRCRDSGQAGRRRGGGRANDLNCATRQRTRDRGHEVGGEDRRHGPRSPGREARRRFSRRCAKGATQSHPRQTASGDGTPGNSAHGCGKGAGCDARVRQVNGRCGVHETSSMCWCRTARAPTHPDLV